MELGADKFLISSDASAMDKAQSSFDLIIDTVPVKHDLNPYTPLLDIDGTLVIVGQVGPSRRGQYGASSVRASTYSGFTDWWHS